MIEIIDVSKSFGDFIALENINIRIKKSDFTLKSDFFIYTFFLT